MMIRQARGEMDSTGEDEAEIEWIRAGKRDGKGKATGEEVKPIQF